MSVLEPKAVALRHDGATAISVAIDGAAADVMVISDPIKGHYAGGDPCAEDRFAAGHDDGDNLTAAEVVAPRFGIDEVHAEILSQDKGDG